MEIEPEEKAELVNLIDTVNRLTRERDALLKDLYIRGDCSVCTHFPMHESNQKVKLPCDDCAYGTHWQWRGLVDIP
jgi:hypothetical protein